MGRLPSWSEKFSVTLSQDPKYRLRKAPWLLRSRIVIWDLRVVQYSEQVHNLLDHRGNDYIAMEVLRF